MPEGWNFYFCKVNDVLASIALDLSLRKQVPDLTRPELLWAWVYFKSPRPDGLSDSLYRWEFLRRNAQYRADYNEFMPRFGAWLERRGRWPS